MLLKPILLFLALSQGLRAVNLYVSSYSGTITSLALLKNANETYTLFQTSNLETQTTSPSWLTLNRQNNILYLVDEAVNARNGTIVTYKTTYNGQLKEIQRAQALEGGVYATFYSSGSAIAVPHYTGSALQTYNVTSTGQFEVLETFTYKLDAPGTVPSRQDSPHLHEAILDPTQQYLLVPDLGADLVRIYYINTGDNSLREKSSLRAAPGSGPRHGAFTLDPISRSYTFYLAAEIASTVTAYKVTYEDSSSGLTFDLLSTYSSLAPGEKVPPTTTGESTGVAAEIAVSPDGSTVFVSNRRDLSFNNTTPPSDSVAAFSISPSDGKLTFQDLFPAGGSYPRQFSINTAGTLMAVGLQESSLVAILAKDPTSGLFDREVASIGVAGQVTCVVWDE